MEWLVVAIIVVGLFYLLWRYLDHQSQTFFKRLDGDVSNDFETMDEALRKLEAKDE